MKKQLSEKEKDYILFSILLSHVLKKKSASIGLASGLKYIETAYSNYLNDGNPIPEISWVDKLPEASIKWAEDYVKDDFSFMKSPPKWLELNWLFHDGLPMFFVGQLSDENMIGGEYPRQIYIFKGWLKSEQDKSKELYKYCIQEKDADGYIQSSSSQTF